MAAGTIFNIQRFSLHDGPGIRTTVFLKGCPLDCMWCHNPESKSGRREIFFDINKCTLCKHCADVCKYGCHIFSDNAHIFNRNKCTVCGKCAAGCPSEALEIVGEVVEDKKVIDEVMKDKMFYIASNGGITLSGGEPMSQFEFSLSLAKLAKERKITVCMQTCGHAKTEQYREIAPFIDMFFFDYKESAPQKHLEETKKSNNLILKNLYALDDLGVSITLCCPIIPTVNDRADHFAGIAETAKSLKNIKEIRIEPYHPLGLSKCEKLNKDYKLKHLTFPDKETVLIWSEEIKKHTQIPVILA